jgi:hypothetical protein
MKIVKLQKEDSKISRKVISQFGESVYGCTDVKSVLIKIHFKDGSTLGFKRDEEEDDIKDMIERAKEEISE